MGILTDNERQEVWAEWMKLNDEDISITKQELRAVFNALDGWFDGSMSDANSSIPLPQRTALSQRQKAFILTKVIEKRFLTGA